MESLHAPLAQQLAVLIKDAIHGEGGLIQMAREIKNGDPDLPLVDESFDSVSSVLWCDSDTVEMTHAARAAGYLTALFDLARRLQIELPVEVNELSDWCYAIFPN
jgi:hypothetical protein